MSATRTNPVADVLEAVGRLGGSATETADQAQRQLAEIVESFRDAVQDAVNEASTVAAAASELATKLVYASIGAAVVVQEEVAQRVDRLPLVVAVRDAVRR